MQMNFCYRRPAPPPPFSVGEILPKLATRIFFPNNKARHLVISLFFLAGSRRYFYYAAISWTNPGGLLFFAGLGFDHSMRRRRRRGRPPLFLRSRVAVGEGGRNDFCLPPPLLFMTPTNQPGWDGTAGRTRCIPCFVGVCGFSPAFFLFGRRVCFFCFFATEESSKNLSVTFTGGEGEGLSQTL